MILDNSTHIIVPDNVTLTCGGNNTGLRQNDDYRIFDNNGQLKLTNAIVLDPTVVDATFGGHGYKIALTGINSGLVGCNVEAGAGVDTGSGPPNPYSPSVYFPNCLPTAPCTPGSNAVLRSSINEYSAFNPNPTALYNDTAHCGATAPYHCGPASDSIGVYVTAENAVVRDVTTLGFGTCYHSAAGDRMVIAHLYGDCNGGIRIVGLGGGAALDNFHIRSLLNGGLHEASINAYVISSVGNSSGQYQVTVNCDSTFAFQPGDTVWLGTSPATGLQSAGGRWTLQSVSPMDCTGGTQTLVLKGSVYAIGTGLSGKGNVSNVPVNGVPANAITGLTSSNLRLISVGQQVSDSGTGGANCIPGSTTVTDIWYARGIAYLSAPVTCTATGDALTFTDTPFVSPGTCSVSPDTNLKNGCIIVDASMRFGDGFEFEQGGGVKMSGCAVAEHMVAYHMFTAANNTRVTNCTASDNVGIPDDNIISLLIDGDHATGKDACDIGWMNGILGQHRPVAVVVNSTCNDRDLLTNVTMGATGSRNNGIAMELDAGSVSVTNGAAGNPDNIFVADYAYMINVAGTNYHVGDVLTGLVSSSGTSGSCSNVTIAVTAIDSAGGVAAYSIVTPGTCTGTAAPSSISWPVSAHGGGTPLSTGLSVATAQTVNTNGLAISNNALPKTTLYVQNGTAAASISGCGNTFTATTPYLCAPSSVTQAPGGRLTLCATPPCAPVMTADVTGATTIYYVPYTGRQMPMYNSAPGNFGLSDIGASGLSFPLDATKHAQGKLYDLFAQTASTSDGLPRLCSAANWNGGNTSRTSEITNINGIWVNAVADMQCWRDNTLGNVKCPLYECTYLGTFYATAAGQTSQQFGPVSQNGGGNNVIGLFNAYNRVKASAASVDSTPGGWSCTAPGCSAGNWQPLDKGAVNGGKNNRITFVDGLQVNAIRTSLVEANANVGSTFPQVGLCIDDTGTACVPPNPAQNANGQRVSLPYALVSYPVKGLHYVQAVQSAVGSGGTMPFGTGATISLDWEY